MSLRTNPQLYRAINSTETPHILIFQITSVRPTVDFHCQTILPFIHISGNVKLSRSHGIFTVSYLFTVYPYIHGRLHPFEMQVQPLTFHFFRNIKRSHIRAHRITVFITEEMLRRLSRHPWLIFLKRISPVSIDRFPIPLQLPSARYSDIVPSANIEITLIEINRALFRVSRPHELPCSIQ